MHYGEKQLPSVELKVIKKNENNNMRRLIPEKLRNGIIKNFIFMSLKIQLYVKITI